MTHAHTTCWTLVEGAAAGELDARDVFARTYLPVIRAYLAGRWSGSALRSDLDDAVQDTFIECFRDAGALQRMAAPREGRFRAFLLAVVTNVARRFEERRGREALRRRPLDPEAPSDDVRASRAFDQAWAEALLRRAAARQEADARSRGDDAVRRVELLRLRFGEGRPIRDIAELWGMDAAVLHREYAKARDEFKTALLAEIEFHHPSSPRETERECRELLELLQ